MEVGQRIVIGLIFLFDDNKQCRIFIVKPETRVNGFVDLVYKTKLLFVFYLFLGPLPLEKEKHSIVGFSSEGSI